MNETETEIVIGTDTATTGTVMTDGGTIGTTAETTVTVGGLAHESEGTVKGSSLRRE